MKKKCLDCKEEYIVLEWTDCKTCEKCGSTDFAINPKERTKEDVAESKKMGVIVEIAKERARQDKKWGIQNHAPFKWLAILGEEVGEANKAALEDKPDEYRNELIQVAAVAMAMVECHDRHMEAAKEEKDECEKCMSRKDFMYYDCQLCKQR